MVFSSLIFLSVFLPAVFLVSLLLTEEFHSVAASNVWLLIASLLFYAYGEPVYVLLMIGSAFFSWLCAVLIDAGRSPVFRRAILALSVTVSILLLVVFKYAGFLTECVNAVFHLALPVPQIRLPIGISFFTFQALSYVIDVYRKDTKAEHSFPLVLLYISFFPQLIAGPIVKYHDVAVQIRGRHADSSDIQSGLRRFLEGLCKKILIANVCAQASDAVFSADLPMLTAPLAWVGAAAYMLQIYYDFSGYSDMAIGLGRMFGFHFLENFNYPYISGSIREFWRRWHISLSSWFKEYVYIPLGGSRKGRGRTVLNRFLVFALTGIWHGANVTFLLWGLYHGALLMIEELVPRISHPKTLPGRILGHAYTLLAVLTGFVYFNASGLTQGNAIVRAMFTGSSGAADAASAAGASSVLLASLLTPKLIAAAACGILFSMPVIPWLKERTRGSAGADVIFDIASLAGLVLCILELASGSYNPFIYFRF